MHLTLAGRRECSQAIICVMGRARQQVSEEALRHRIARPLAELSVTDKRRHAESNANAALSVFIRLDEALYPFSIRYGPILPG